MRIVTHPELVSWRGSLDAEVLELWRAGRNTREIAGAMFFRESVIANRLPGILERARQNQEWNFDNICNGVRETWTQSQPISIQASTPKPRSSE